jgi:hypothetical protein
MLEKQSEKSEDTPEDATKLSESSEKSEDIISDTALDS